MNDALRRLEPPPWGMRPAPVSEVAGAAGWVGRSILPVWKCSVAGARRHGAGGCT